MSDTHLCDVCRKNGMVGVASSALGAISWAYCRECLLRNAEPEVMFAHIFEDVSDNGDGVADWVKEMSTFKDGRYVPWDEYAQMRRSVAKNDEPSSEA